MTYHTDTPPRASKPSIPASRPYRNVGYWLLTLPIVMLAGFWVPYLSQLPRSPAEIAPTIHLHALLLFIWMTLLVLQPLLIRRAAGA